MKQKKQIKKKGSVKNGIKHIDASDIPRELPVLPAKDLVAFPSVMMALYVVRSSSIAAVEYAMKHGKLLFVVGQRDSDTDDPQIRDLYKVGVVANIIRTLRVPDDRYKVLIQGVTRANALSYKSGEFLTANVEALHSPPLPIKSQREKIIADRIRSNLQLLVEREHLPEEMLLVTEEMQDLGMLADVILAHYRLETSVAQRALEELDPRKRLELTDKIIADDFNRFMVSENIRDRARDELNKGQREYYLREQIRQIQRELGETDTNSEDLAHLKASLVKVNMPKLAFKEAMKQFSRLEKMTPESSEFALLRTYLDWLSEIPWSIKTKDRIDLKAAKKILDQDHYGLDKAKERILEYLGVRKLNKDLKGPILCFVGPPGVGKTSLGTSIARALGRRFFRMSLGGVRDEAEIRGHRRTYVGALPGRIVQGLKQANSRNPVIVLDELDKVGSDFRGDPASALLEVLDPHQNKEFRDHYLNINFDLSDVLFIATANTVDTIPEALLDRLEIIYISGYTTEEKKKIAEKFIIPRQLQENGLENKKVNFTEDAIIYLIERYTSEAGVRNLEREIGALCRKIAKEYTESKKIISKIDCDMVGTLLGPTKFDPETRENRELVGVARGLAWTVNGGEIMPVEASVAKGNGGLNLTGQLGSVMQESAQAAVFYARANAKELGLDPAFQQKLDIHVHVPGGATPKDGPSAGVTIAAALVSALSGKKIRRDVAMTGEITLRGSVMAVGGLKEKALAALRYGIKKVIIPEENIKDTEEIPKEQRSQIKFIPVKDVNEVLNVVLVEEEKKKRKSTTKKKSKNKRRK